MEDDARDEAALQQAAWEVYGAPPADFVATRTRWVKELRSRGQREAATAVAALRKPSVSAAAVNALVRAQDPAADRLGDVGTRLRHAQSALDAEGLAALRGARDEVLRDWVQAAREHAPGPLTTSGEAEVRDTAVAALADGAAAEVVLSGTLTRALSYSGFGEVDVSDAVARTSTGVVLTRIEGGDPEAGSAADDAEVDAGPQEGVHEPDEAGEDHERGDSPEEATPEQDEGESGDDAGEDDELGGQEDQDDELSTAALARLAEGLTEAEQQVTAARRARRTALEAAHAAADRVLEAEERLLQARSLLTRAEGEAESARAAEEQARTDLADADAALAGAREVRDEARTTLEEAQDAG